MENQELLETTDNVNQAKGYLSAMNDLINYIKAETGFKPQNRMIDSVGLTNWISGKSEEIKQSLKL